MSDPTALVRTVDHGPAQALSPWDPFQLMDRMDEEALAKELQGIASQELVYVVKEGSQEVVGLSKVGVDECCMVLVTQGQVIREESLDYEILGEGEDREALFKVKAARYAVNPDGHEVRLDQVLGVKRQPLYYESQPLTLDSKVPSKKYRGQTYRQLLEQEEGRDYLGWMAENFSDTAIRDFARAALNGEAIEVQPGRKPNPHWYEAGAMKAARNARFRLIPAQIRAQVILSARQSGATREIQGTQPVPRPRAPEQAAPVERTESVSARVGPYAPSEKQVAYYQNLVASPVFSEEEKERALDWLEQKATRQTIKDQIDWLKRQVETRTVKADG